MLVDSVVQGLVDSTLATLKVLVINGRFRKVIFYFPSIVKLG